RISPAPRLATCLANSTASRPVGLRPPWVNTSQWSPTRLASTATTMHWLPNCSANSFTTSGRFTAAVLSETLSAPASSRRRTSSAVRTPPPTVSGMKQASAVRATTSRMVPRFSEEAVMSRKHSSSAPAASYTLACSTGSPASTRSTNCTPLTTRPSFTSRQGMMRLVSMSGRLLRQLQGVFQLEPPVVNRPARNHAFPLALGFRRLHQRLDVGNIRHPAGGDDGKGGLLRQFHRRLKVHALQQAIPAHVGEQHGGDARILETAGQFGNGDVGNRGPAVGRHHAVFCIHCHHDLVRVFLRRLFHEVRVLQRRRADDEIGRAHV